MAKVAYVAALLTAALAVSFAVGGASATTTAAPSFSNITLWGGQGAEPSIAIDTSPTSSRNDVYVGAIGDANGPLEWHSYSDGAGWSSPVPFDLNGPLRGGDDDLAVNTNGDLIATDLDVSHASVQISRDHGKTFTDGTITAPEDDRPWLTTAGPLVYVAYHDFVGEVPVVCRSLDGGQNFSTCTQAFSGNSSVSACAENTIPARSLVIDPTDYSLNFLYSCSTAAENAQHPPYGPLHDYYLAKSTDGGLTWTTYPVLNGNTSNGKAPNYANIFGNLAVDSAGNFYALYAGTSDDNNADIHPYHVYLKVSRTHGKTWSAPIQVDRDFNGMGTHVLPHLAVTAPGNVDVVWYGTSRSGEPNGVCGTLASQHPCTNSQGQPDGFPPYTAKNAPAWRVYMAQSRNALSSTRTFTEVAANPTPAHYGRICSNGIVCGSSDRSLLDFISVGVDCHGYAHVAYGANTRYQESKDRVYVHVANQTGGVAIAPPAACGVPVH
jgi:hypothetical protein